MELKGFIAAQVNDSDVKLAKDKNQIGKTISIKDYYGTRAFRNKVSDTSVHDANFAFLSTTLAKLHELPYEPLYNVTWAQDIPVKQGGGFVDYVEFTTVNVAGITNSMRNVAGNSTNYIPRVNAGLTQNTAPVFTYEVAYDLRFIELEKMKKLTLQKSIQEIYQNAITIGWDFFVQEVAYMGTGTSLGLFNSDKVLTTTIDNSASSGKGFEGIDDEVVVAAFNNIFNQYLIESNMNIGLLPNVILVPSFVGRDLSDRINALYTNSLRSFLIEHNLGKDESDGDLKLSIRTRRQLDDINGGKGRIVAYRNDSRYVRIDMPFPLQHYITLPNMERVAYTTIFVGQVSAIQMPFNSSNETLGPVTYWDFTK